MSEIVWEYHLLLIHWVGTLAMQGAEAPILENQIPKIGWKY